MSAPGKAGRVELADIVGAHAAALRERLVLSPVQYKALRAIEGCRTSALGGQLLRCQQCGESQFRYHSCRNRHCPKCQSLAKERWLAARRAELLPVPYFHLVFTLPSELRALSQGNPHALYALLFRATAQTLQAFGADARWLGGDIAATLTLHTWTQQLDYHPHIHALVAGGALGRDGRWIGARRGFLFPVHALSKLFRGKFLAGLQSLFTGNQLKLGGSTAALADPAQRNCWLSALYATAWVVYTKPSLSGPEPVLDYLARYTHKVALSNERILGADDTAVRLAWRDRAHGNRRRVLTLAPQQFLERYLRHILPPGFTRIRHIGLLASRHKRSRLARAGAALDAPAPAPVVIESVAACLLQARCRHRHPPVPVLQQRAAGVRENAGPNPRAATSTAMTSARHSPHRCSDRRHHRRGSGFARSAKLTAKTASAIVRSLSFGLAVNNGQPSLRASRLPPTVPVSQSPPAHAFIPHTAVP